MTHGNGPQVGELALERAAATFDVLGAESMGQIGYVLAQAMQSAGVTAVPILTQVVVDQFSDAFKDPTKFVGPIYGAMEAQALQSSLGWTIKPDGEYFRRVVPSPPPLEILQVDAVRALLEHAPNVLPIACGGGGVPVARIPSNPSTLQGMFEVLRRPYLCCHENSFIGFLLYVVQVSRRLLTRMRVVPSWPLSWRQMPTLF